MSGQEVMRQFHFAVRARGRREVVPGPKPVEPVTGDGRVPRVVRLMALAVHFDGLIRAGAIRDQAEAARLGHVSRARMTQVMNLLHLAPDLQLALLDLPRVHAGRDPLTETALRHIVAEPDWHVQRSLWRDAVGSAPARIDS